MQNKCEGLSDSALKSNLEYFHAKYLKAQVEMFTAQEEVYLIYQQITRNKRNLEKSVLE